MNSFFSIFAFLMWLTGVCLGNTVDQSPGDLIKKQDESAVIKCEHKIQNYNRLLWYKQSQDILGFKLMGYLSFKDENKEPEFNKTIKLDGDARDKGTLTIKSIKLLDSAVYFCADTGSQAYFGGGTKLTVLDPDIPVSSPEVRIIKPSDKELCKKAVTLVCVAENFYPDHVTIKWKIGEDVVTKGLATDPYATPNKVTKKFDMSSRLKIRPNVWNDAKKKFTCIVTFYNGKNYTHESAEIYGIAGNGFNKEDHMTQAGTVKLAYGVFIAKSGLYGIFIFFFVRRQVSAGK